MHVYWCVSKSLFPFVCLYVCMYVCMYVYVCVCVCVCVCVYHTHTLSASYAQISA